MSKPSKRVLEITEGREFAAGGVGKFIRRQAGVSLQGIGDVVGVNQATVWHWENGTKRPFGVNAIRYRRFIVELRDREQPRVPA